MRDIYFSYAMLCLTVATAGAYGARTFFRGRARHERADKDGGSLFVGKRFMEFGYWLMDPLVAVLHRAGVTPDMVTVFSLLPALIAGVAVSQGWFGLACVLATFASLSDAVDGLLARRRGSASDAGEAFDAVVDRYVEFFLMGGLIVYYRASLILCVAAIFALFGAFMVSYSTAKAEALNVPPPRGSMRRAERAIYLLFAAGLTPFAGAISGPDANVLFREGPMIGAVGLIAVVSNVSVIARLRAIVRAIRLRDAARAGAALAAHQIAPSDTVASAPEAVGDKSRSAG
ncbi:MAG: CDP-alcohol phosphatidyltransferase family protein [Deltaproteobacteria bacterium]|nr:CDP-alcohol phosphatidyltransferase family protein [Deltaproteobacteria bacterium]